MPSQEADAWAPAALAATRLVAAHCPLVPAVQSDCERAVCVAPSAAAFASPWVRVLQAVPAQEAVTSAVSGAVKPPVPAWHTRAAAHDAVAVAFTPAAPVAVVFDEAAAAQPAAVPSSQAAVTEALVDRELYLPASWTEDRDRCAAAGIPAEVGFGTKPRLGIAMLARAHAAGVLTGWVSADEAFGQNRAFRTWLARREVPFVLATRSDDMLVCPDGRRHQAKNLVGLAGSGAWERRSAGLGAHGERLYDWAVLALDATAKPEGLPAGWSHWLLVRRQIDPPPGKDPELAFYRCAGPAATPIPELIRVAAARWAIEECFQTAKNEAGLDHYQVRGYRAWYAHITLAMLAAAYLAATRAQEAKKGDLNPPAAPAATGWSR